MFPIISEDFRRLPEISGEKSENVSTIYQGQTVHSLLQQGKDVVETCIISYLLQCKDTIFLSERNPCNSIQFI